MSENLMTARYSRLSMILHWLMLALFVGVYGCIEIKGLLPRGHALKGLFLGAHALFGIGIFLLVWLRLLGHWLPLGHSSQEGLHPFQILCANLSDELSPRRVAICFCFVASVFAFATSDFLPDVN